MADLPRDDHLHAALRHAPDRDAAPGELLSARILAAGRRAAEEGVRGSRPTRSGWLGGRLAWPWAGAGSLAAALLAATVLFVGHDELPEAPARRSADSAPAPAESGAASPPAAGAVTAPPIPPLKTSLPPPPPPSTTTPAQPPQVPSPSPFAVTARPSPVTPPDRVRSQAAPSRPAAFPETTPAPPTPPAPTLSDRARTTSEDSARRQAPRAAAPRAAPTASSRAESGELDALQERVRARATSRAAVAAPAPSAAPAQVPAPTPFTTPGTASGTTSGAVAESARQRAEAAAEPRRAEARSDGPSRAAAPAGNAGLAGGRDAVGTAVLGAAAGGPAPSAAALPAPAASPPAAPSLRAAGDARLGRAGEASLQALAQRAQESAWEWRQTGGQRGPAGAAWLEALRNATRPLANPAPEPADATDELTLWSGDRLLARLLLRGSELWICDPAAGASSGACELRTGQAAELQALWRPAARSAR